MLGPHALGFGPGPVAELTPLVAGAAVFTAALLCGGTAAELLGGATAELGEVAAEARAVAAGAVALGPVALGTGGDTSLASIGLGVVAHAQAPISAAATARFRMRHA